MASRPLSDLLSGEQAGIALILATTFFFVSMDTLVKHLVQSYPVAQVVWARYFFHLLLMALIDSYTLFVPGQAPPIEDFADLFTRIVSQSFALGLQLAAPFVAIGIVFYVGLGLMSRLMPSMQIFFIAIPLQIMLGMLVLTIALPIIMHWFIRAFEMRMFQFLVP